MLILMLIMMLKLCVKESPNLIGRKNFGTAEFSIRAGLRWCSPISQEVTKSPPTRVPPQIFEIPTVIACFCWSLPICKIWTILDTSDHLRLKWLKVLFLFLPYHMQKNELYNSPPSWDKGDALFVVTLCMFRHTWACLLEAAN